MIRRILITGGAGRLGTFLTKELRKEYKIRILDSIKPDTNRQCDFIQGDIRNLKDVEKATKDVDVIIHLAAIPLDTGEAPKIMEINVMGTFNILEAAARNGIKKVMYASSISAVGFVWWKKPFTPDYFPVDEKHPCKPSDTYGLSKLIGEELYHAYSRAYNIHAVCLRLATIWFPDWERGPYAEKNRRRMAEFIDHIKKPECNVHRIWNYVDVRDVVQAFKLCLGKKDIKWEIYNIGAADVCANVSSLELVKRYYPQVKHLRNKNNFLIEENRALFDISKAKEELGYIPKHTWKEYL